MRLGVDIMGTSEMWWTGTQHYTRNDHTIYFSGRADHQHICGVGIIISKNIQHVSNFTPISERILVIQLESSTIKINVIQVYAPTADRPEEEVEEFYNSISEIVSQFRKQEVTLIMRDFDAKIGKEKRGKMAGEDRLGTRNERGERLDLFAESTIY